MVMVALVRRQFRAGV